MIKLTRVVKIIVGLFLSTHLLASASIQKKIDAEQTCALSVAPKESKKLSNHAVTFHIYPKSIASGFTGCQRTWFDDGPLFLSVRYLNGDVIEIELNEPDAPQMVCGYHASQVNQAPKVRCAEILSSIKRQKRSEASREVDRGKR